jgi:hypothetical protein
MDGFSGYNQINIAPEDQHKTAFICPWGTFAYRKLPFGLKNAGAMFQRAMSYAFHDIKHIVQPYLDDLPAHSLCRVDQPTHLRAIFVRCRFYRIRLNPHKCVFCVESRRLLGFIVSRHGIRVDPIKVEAILNLPPPSSLRHLQSLQRKENFLRRFILLAFGSHSWIASRSRARSPLVLMSRFVLKGDQMEENSKQCRINSETGPGMHERVRS